MTNQNNEKSKNGKRIALILLALLLIAAIAFGAYTYSKYVSSGNGSGSATVAKWGFTITVDDAKEYTDNFGFANDYSTTGESKDGAESAVISASSESTNIVGPGAKGGTTFSVTGRAEVEATLTAEITGKQIFLTIADESGNTYVYTPVVYTYNGVSGTISEINTKLGELNQKVAANQSVSIDNASITWAWAFEGAAEGLTLPKESGDGSLAITQADVDVLDTALAQLSVKTAITTTTITVSGTKYTIQEGEGDYNLTESVNLKITLTQSGITQE